MRNFSARMGVLRLVLAVLIIASLPLVFLQESASDPISNIVIGQVIPALVLMVFWAIPLDILMARIYMAEQDEDVRRRYVEIIRFDLGLMGVLLIMWGPFFLRALSV